MASTRKDIWNCCATFDTLYMHAHVYKGERERERGGAQNREKIGGRKNTPKQRARIVVESNCANIATRWLLRFARVLHSESATRPRGGKRIVYGGRINARVKLGIGKTERFPWSVVARARTRMHETIVFSLRLHHGVPYRSSTRSLRQIL